MPAPSQLDRLRAALSEGYRVEKELGRGGMATVYLAEDLRHGRWVAVKVLHPDLAAAVGPDRFLREVRTTAGLRHPNILPLFDSGEADGLLYYSMPLVDGESLRDRLDRERQLPVDEAVRIAREVAQALEHAHGKGVLHRDIKPANILLEGGRAVLADFGIARAAVPDPEDHLTKTGLAVGTPAYMSPEQAMAEREIDGRTDLYALGCVLFEMLAGEPPYTGPTARAILAKRFHEPVPRVSTLRDTVSPGLDAVLQRLLSTSPVDRPASAGALVRALDEHATAPGIPRHQATATGRGHRITPAILAVTVLAAGAFGASRFLDRAASDAPSASPDRLAVVPFAVRGSDRFAYLGEGMVDLMSAKLDGAGALTVVNPRAVISMVNTEDVDLIDPAAVAGVARRFGAGRYLTGEVIEVGGRLQVTAQLHTAGAGAAAPRTASVETAPEQLLQAIDSLAFRLLAETMDTPDARIGRLATVTTASLPALKEFLDGERLMRAGGQYREAAAAFERAIAHDPGFALAWYRKSSVGEWIDLYDVRSSADSAFKYVDGLSRRDRSLLEALRLRRVGRTVESREAFLAHLQTWPDEVDALVQLGEMGFHDNPRVGRPMDEAIPYFRAALELEPTNADARIHLARLYALTGQLDSLEAQLRQMEEDFARNSDPNLDGGAGERLLEVRALGAFASGDSARKAEIGAQLAGRPVPHFFVLAHGVSRFARDPAGALDLLRRSHTPHPFLQWTEASLTHVLGRRAEYFRITDELVARGSPQWDLERAFVLTSGIVPRDEDRLEAVLRSLVDAEPADMRRGSWVPAYEDLTDDFHRLERDWNVALILIHLGRIPEARTVMAGLESMPPLTAMGNLQADAQRMLEAEILYREGDRSGALDVLRTITYEAPHGATYHALADGTRSRYLRAELELELGDRRVAERLFRGFDESWSPWDGYHRPLAVQRLAELAAADGRTDDARRYYAFLLEFWRNCDEDLVPLREEIRARWERL